MSSGSAHAFWSERHASRRSDGLDRCRTDDPGAVGARAPETAPAGPAGPDRARGRRGPADGGHRPDPQDRPELRETLVRPVCPGPAGGPPARGRPIRPTARDRRGPPADDRDPDHHHDAGRAPLLEHADPRPGGPREPEDHPSRLAGERPHPRLGPPTVPREGGPEPGGSRSGGRRLPHAPGQRPPARGAVPLSRGPAAPYTWSTPPPGATG